MEGGTSLVIPLLGGLLSFASPCIIPMITVYLSLITGMTLEELMRQGSRGEIRKSIVSNTALFILGFGAVFTAAGGAAGWMVGALSEEYISLLSKIGGVVVILLGAHLAGVFKLGFLHRLHLANLLPMERRPVGALGSFLVGTFFAIACSHCIGPLLYSTLIYAATAGSAAQGMQTMAAFSLGLAIPYLGVALAISSALGHLERLRRYSSAISRASGLLLMFFGLLLATGRFTLLSNLFSRLLPYKLPGGM